MNISLIRISDPDLAPEWLSTSMPLEMRAIREFKSDDGTQYILTELLSSIQGPNEVVTHLVVGGRMEGQPLSGGVGGTPTNVAYVTDQTLLDDEKIDFNKAIFVASALGACIPKPVVRLPEVSKKWWKFWE